MKIVSKLLAVTSIAAIAVLAAPTSRADTITVVAGTTHESLWTDTGIDLTGQTINITASGAWSWAFGENVGPDGSLVAFVDDEWIQNGRHGQLIAYVGGDPLLGTAGAPGFTDYIAIGSNGSITGLTGRLWLGFNDDYSSGGEGDNSGSVQATITSVPDSGTSITLFGLALFAMAAARRKLALA